ncbi:hypothetical protein HMPREF1121_00078 [Porphyromonas sp. KLE 1280]|uniref:DUF5683 domain-containing protein n=1 Tax=Porphyromonas sp. KLE 1280 TaxID=997829 RepID=UPI0004D90436|nr:DUF5683 domain-containing protein [Porphyromonas sp. KLE 1280]KDU79345.1 hypothetical protein HMPREF1121_00078 [Porphyromonas sp. KLE 1280]
MRIRLMIALLSLLILPHATAWSQKSLVPAIQDMPSLLSASDSVAPSTQEPLPSFEKQALKIQQQALWQPNSTKAILWAFLPGGGQIYNRKYWKLPIVWGAFMACYYSITWNNRQYQEYHAAYRDLSGPDPEHNTSWLVFAPTGAQASDYQQYQSSLRSTLKRGNDFYRRYRDLSIVATVLVYGLSILDAYVDAELYTFDISPDLSLRVVPEVGLPKLGLPSYQMGVNCSLTF